MNEKIVEYIVHSRRPNDDMWHLLKVLPTIEDAELYVRTERIDRALYGVKFRISKRTTTVQHLTVQQYG